MNEHQRLITVLQKASRLAGAGKHKDALALIKRQKGALATHPELMKVKARILTGMERYRESQKILEGLLFKFPRDVGAIAGAAMNLNMMGAHNQAVEYAERAVKLEPRNIGLLLNLASTYRASGRTNSAVEVLIHADRAAPKQQDIALLLSELLIGQGRFLEALQRLSGLANSPPKMMLLLDCYCKLNWYDDALALVPEVERALVGQGDYYKALFVTRLQQLGEFARIEKLLDGPAPAGNPQLLHRYIQSAQLDAGSLLKLAQSVETAGFGKDDTVALLFALSSRLFACHENEPAFRLLEAANRKRAVPIEEQQAAIAIFDEIKAAFPAWKGKGFSGSSSRVPLFVIGMPRSGTTLVESILLSHSQVASAGEAVFMDTSLNGPGDAPPTHASSVRYLREMNDWDETKVREIAESYLVQLRQHSGKSAHIIDKLPHNFLHLGVIRTLFPEATIVHCTRNPIANCLSIYQQHLSDFHAYSAELSRLGEYYKQYQALMALWKAEIDRINLVEVSYESLVTDTEPAIRKLLADCSLPFEEACLDFHGQARVVGTLSYSQVRNRVYRTRLKNWENQEAHIKPLLDAFPESA